MGIIVSNADDCGERRTVLSGINSLLFCQFRLHRHRKVIGIREDKVCSNNQGDNKPKNTAYLYASQKGNARLDNEKNYIFICASASYAIFRNTARSIEGYCSCAFTISTD